MGKERERDDFGKPQAPEQKKRARFERKRNPNNNPAGPLSPQNLVCREASVTRNGSDTLNTCLSEKQAKEVFSLVPPLPAAATAAWRRTWRRRETRASTSTRGPPRISSLTR